MTRQIRILPVLMLVSLLSGGAFATPGCLKAVQNSAEKFQRCLVNQEVEGQCESLQEELAGIEAVCISAGGNKRIEVARQMGVFRVSGDPSKSPYSQEKAYQNEVRRLLDINKSRYENLFGQILPYSSRNLEDGFDERCEFAFAGAADNYTFMGYLVTRNNGDRDLSMKTEGIRPITHLYFGKMERKFCFRPGTTEMTDKGAVPDYPDYVYNLKKVWIDALPDESPVVVRREERGSQGASAFRLKKPLIVEVKEYPSFMEGAVVKHTCRTIMKCLEIQEYFFEHYEQYKQALKDFQEATACSDYLKSNDAGEIDIGRLYGKPCDKDTVSEERENARLRMDELENILF